MSQAFVPGPVFVFTGTGASGAYEFLGLSEDGVNLQLIASYEDVYSDAGGPMVPTDVQWMGEQGYAAMTLIKYNESVLQKLAGRRVGTSVVAGATEANGLGSLMIAEGYAYQLLLLFPYRTKSFQSGDMVPCYQFGAAYLNDDFTIPVSVRVKRPRVVFRMLPVWNTVALTSILYTNILPSPVPTPD